MASLAATLPERDDIVIRPAAWARQAGEGSAQASGEAAVQPYERAVYQPSRRAGPIAAIATCGIMLAVVAALATLNVVAEHQARKRLTVTTFEELDTTPPPPPPERLEQVAPAAAVFVPKPAIEIPSEGPKQVMLDAPPPPAPPVAIAAPVTASAPAAPAAAAATSTVEGGDLSSKVLSARPPVYPVDARRRREQGTVKLLVLVGPDGHVKDISVAASSGSERLDHAAVHAVRRWRWSPTRKDGMDVAVRGYVTIPFILV